MTKTPLFTVLALLLASSVYATTVFINPVEDAFVSGANPNSNYGSAGALEVSAAGLPKGEFQSLLKFDLASTKASFDSTFGVGGWAINSITLTLTTANPNNLLFNSNAAGSFSIKWMQNDSWAEGTGTPAIPQTTGITYATLSSFLTGSDQSLGSFSFGGGTSGSNSWNLNLSSSFVADATAGNKVSLLALPNDTGVSYLFNSRNNGTVANRPTLTVSATAVPEPSTMVFLGGMGVVWLVWRLRRARAV